MVNPFGSIKEKLDAKKLEMAKRIVDESCTTESSMQRENTEFHEERSNTDESICLSGNAIASDEETTDASPISDLPDFSKQLEEMRNMPPVPTSFRQVSHEEDEVLSDLIGTLGVGDSPKPSKPKLKINKKPKISESDKEIWGEAAIDTFEEIQEDFVNDPPPHVPPMGTANTRTYESCRRAEEKNPTRGDELSIWDEFL